MSEKDYKNGFQDGYAESLKLGEMGKIEKARKQGAVEELKEVLHDLVYFDDHKIDDLKTLIFKVEKRLLELEKGGN